MTAAYRVVVADCKDIRTLTIVCPECGSEVSLSIETARVPEYCPSCQMQYSLQMREAMGALGRFHRAATAAEEIASKPVFRFSIRQAD